MKAWEKEYAVHPLDFRMVVEPAPSSGPEDEGWYVVADLRVPLGECHDTARLFAASGKMAKTLRGMLCDDRTCTAPQCKTAREALAAAGVEIP